MEQYTTNKQLTTNDSARALVRGRSRGSIVIVTLVFSTMFLFLVSGLAGFILVQKRAQTHKEHRESALQIAEAGLDYYKWFLAHYPGDLTDGTGTAGPYIHEYDDPEGGTIGEFSLEIDGNIQCGVAMSVDITSTGHTSEEPSLTRTVFGRYAQPSVAEYAYIIDANVWAGDDREIYGPYHTNGGVRMDGTNYSTVAAAQDTWYCTSSFGCDPEQPDAPGVVGDGPNDDLWLIGSGDGVNNIDFEGISIDLSDMEDIAQANGLFFEQVSGASPRRGYRLAFQSDGTVDVYEVEDSDRIWSYDSESEWKQRYEIPDDETFLGNYDIPADCALIFVEDRVWVEGEISGKVTLAVADVTNPVYSADVLITGNITYTTDDGSAGLTIVGQNSILLPLLVPDTMELNGIFIAQGGHFGRNHYTTGGSKDVPSSLNDYVDRDSLTMHGTVVSSGRVGTRWTCGGSYCSGFADRTNSYDRNLADDPPPMTPFVSDDYEFIQWREEI